MVPRRVTPVPRQRLDDVRPDRLYFAQVREDPLLELEVLRPHATGTYAVVGSGGCTALSLRAAGAGRVVAVDLNPVQNDLLELKHAAVVELGSRGAVCFLGGAPADGDRWPTYLRLRDLLTPGARATWDRRRRALRRGVLGAGVTEALIRLFVRALRVAVHRKATLEELLSLEDLEAQRGFWADTWDTRRWRLLVRLLLSRRSLTRTYDPAFFQAVEERDFASGFAARIEHTLTELPVRENYFLHHMLQGRYPENRPESLPPYLQPGGVEGLRHGMGGLEVVDGGYTTWLEHCEPRSIDGFALSNIGEWLSPRGVDRLFAEVARTAAPGARVCFRNFVGWTDVPPRWRSRIVEDRARGEALMARDRSLVQRRFVPCRVVEAQAGGTTGSAPRVVVRDARPEDDPALRELAAACPMRGDIEICSEREPDFFALTALEGERSRVAVSPAADGRPGGCITVAERRCRVNGRERRIVHVGDLKVHPSLRDGAMADALTAWARRHIRRELGDDATILITVLAGNRAMERRLPGSAVMPAFTRVGTIRSWSVPVLGPRRSGVGSLSVASASPGGVEAMADLWRRVAPLRQFTPVLDAPCLARWIEEAPGLDPSDYLLARDDRGALLGFLGLWDQRAFKQLRVIRYTRRLRLFRRAFNAVAPFLGAAGLPSAGSRMSCLTAVHPCVPPDRPDVLRALLCAGYRRARATGHTFFNVGLDADDPLASAFRGFLAQTTDIHVYLSSPQGTYAGPSLDGRPLHYEIALV